MRNKIASILLIVTATVFYGCKDFLEPELIEGYDETNFFGTENQVFQGLIAAYDPIQWNFVGGFWTNSVMLGDIRSDNATAGGDPSNNDQPGWQNIDDLTNDETTNETGTFWAKNYAGIRRANLVILNGDLGTPVTDTYIAEAKFLRAFFHFEAFRTYGPIPVVDFLITPETYGVSRNTMTEVFEFIVKDLEEAAAVLPDSYPEEFAGRATRGAALGLLGKAYLYWADLDNDNTATFDLAAAELKKVIDMGQYVLEDDFQNIYSYGNDHSPESVFEIMHSHLEPADWGWDVGIPGNMMIQLSGVRGLCSGHPDYLPGWGFFLPTQDLVDHFLSDDDYRLDGSVISQSELDGESGTTNCVTISEGNLVDWQGYWQQKYANWNSYSAPLGEINVLKDANEKYMRYADVLLMYAEALVRGTGSDAEAMTNIDLVRERAAGPGDNTGSFRTAADLMTDEGWSLLDVIFYERRAEFAGEGDRWFDLVRRGEFNAGSFPAGDLRAGNYTPEDNYLPIAQTEVDASGGTLTLYPDASLFQ